LQAGTRIDMGEKRHITDFALWKFSPAGQKRQMEWDSPWGVGFPGWHIECSTMSVKYLGPFFDIHCGGEDHIPVHHPNEIAQTEACYGTRLANFWMHGHFLQMGEEKMSKSSGHFLRLQDLIDKGYDPLAYRFFCFSAIYRAKLTFTWEGMDGSQKSLERLRSSVFDLGEAGEVDNGYMDQFMDCVNDDLNMPRAMALTWELMKSNLNPATKKATILQFDKVFGLKLDSWKPAETIIPDEVQQLVELRQRAREEKRWHDADTLRDQIISLGYEIADTPQGAQVKQKKN
ncbi:MAG: cysteine--tRNA ligase, partial [Anaerolineaceae bacterium]